MHTLGGSLLHISKFVSAKKIKNSKKNLHISSDFDQSARLQCTRDLLQSDLFAFANMCAVITSVFGS